MSRRLLVLAAPAVLAALILGCNGDGGGSPAPVTTENGTGTPTEFELARDALYQELDSYGANIGVLGSRSVYGVLSGLVRLTFTPP